MKQFTKKIVYPFKFFGIEPQQAWIWFLFTILCGLIGIGMNVWSHKNADVTLYNAIVQEFTVNSFFTYSIVLLTGTAGSLFMKMDKDRLMTFKSIKIWLLIFLCGFVFIGTILCQSRDKLLGYNWYQLAYFVLAIALAVYGFCVVNMDRHLDSFVDLLDPVSNKDAAVIKGLVDKMSKLTEDKKGNRV